MNTEEAMDFIEKCGSLRMRNLLGSLTIEKTEEMIENLNAIEVDDSFGIYQGAALHDQQMLLNSLKKDLKIKRHIKENYKEEIE